MIDSRGGLMRVGIATIVSSLLFLLSGILVAQQPLSMDVFNGAALLDENGATLEDGDILHLLWAGPDGQIDPPINNIGGANNGQPTGDDELLETHVIGENFIPGSGQSFFTVTTYQNQTLGKPAQGDWIYIRAFNDNNLVVATYYGDAQLYQVQFINGENYDPLLSMGTDQTLPVELSGFESISGNNEVLLKWSTHSEVNNLGFELYKSTNEDGEFEQIASYEHNESLKGAGNSTEIHQYSFKDIQVVNDIEYWYKLADVDITGVRTFHGAISATPNGNSLPIIQSDNFPTRFKLHQNYPNPFNPETKIRIELPNLKNKLERVEILVFNNLGMLVRTIYSGSLAPGIYETVWDGKNNSANLLPSGIYYLFFRAETFNQTQKMLLVR